MRKKAFIGKAVSAVLAVLLTFSCVAANTIGLGGNTIKSKIKVVESSSGSHSNPNTQLPYEGKEKEAEDGSEESKSSFLVEFVTDYSLYIDLTSSFCNNPFVVLYKNRTVSQVPRYLAIRSLLI